MQIGEEGERRFGRRHFMEVMSLFLTEPLLLVRWGMRDLGQIDPSVLITRENRTATFLLGGRAWNVEDIDWNRRIAWVIPSEGSGKSRWSGAGAALSAQVGRTMRTMLAEPDVPAELTARGAAKLESMRSHPPRP